MTGPPDDGDARGAAARPQDERGRRSGRPRLSSVLLIGSLAVNLFFGGLLLGGVLGGPRGGPPGGFDSFMALRQAALALPGDGPAVIRQTFMERRGEFRHRIGALQAARRDVREALTADPFDPDRAAAGFAVLRRETVDLQAILHDTFAQAMVALTPEQRRILADRLSRRGGGPPDREGWRGGWMRPDAGPPE